MSFEDYSRRNDGGLPARKQVLAQPLEDAVEQGISERYRLRMASYQRAYELARREAAERKKAFIPPFQFDEDYEAGGGIQRRPRGSAASGTSAFPSTTWERG